MILAVLALSQLGPALAPAVVYTDLAAPIVSYQIVAKVDKSGPRDQAALAVLAEVLPKETEDFTPGRVRLIVFGSGEQARAAAMPDHLRISFSVPKEDKELGFSLLASILRHPRINEENVGKAITSLSHRSVNPWTAALRPRTPSLRKVKLQDVQELAARLLRPENVTIGVGGPVTPAETAKQWDKRFADWTVPPLGRYPTDYSTAEKLDPIHGTYNVDVLAGTPFALSDAAFPTRLLMLFALGVGKESALHRIVREKLGLSYRQETVLVPSPTGVEPRILIAQAAGEETGIADKAIAALKEDIDTWGPDTKARAMAMAEAVFERGLPWDPIAVGEFGNLSDTLADQTFLRTYWRAKTGGTWNPEQMLDRMKAVTPDDLKDAAKAFLDKARVEIVS